MCNTHHLTWRTGTRGPFLSLSQKAVEGTDQNQHTVDTAPWFYLTQVQAGREANRLPFLELSKDTPPSPPPGLTRDVCEEL